MPFRLVCRREDLAIMHLARVNVCWSKLLEVRALVDRGPLHPF